MTRTYSTHTLPHYVRDWFGVRSTSAIRMTRPLRHRWVFDANGKHVEIHARTAPQARRKLADHIATIDGRTDRRRNKWFYT